MRKLWRKDRKLGVAEERHRYDLPLNKTQGSDFLVVLIALMTFLSVMAITTTFVLNDLTAKWSSGLENKLTLELPRQAADGAFISEQQLETQLEQIAKTLNQSEIVQSYQIMSKDEIQDLVSPWLGDSTSWDGIALPALISITTKSSSPSDLRKLESAIQKDAGTARLDTHQDWLDSITTLTGALRLASGFVSVMIIVTILIAVIGAIKSRMAVHHKDIELLHLMGASDTYISRQFQRYATILGLQGGAIGVFGGSILLLGLSLLVQDWSAAEVNIMPNFALSWIEITLILAIPFMMCALCSVTARFTVLRVLSFMP